MKLFVHRFIQGAAGTTRRAASTLAFGLLASLGLVAPATAAQGTTTVPYFLCGGAPAQKIYLEPVPKFNNGEFTNQGADCAMWQTFFYLNWPAAKVGRGIPDPKASFGAPGATVWETFKTEDQTFLPNGAKPGPWTLLGAGPEAAGLPRPVAAKVASGQQRLLTRTSKVSHAVARLQAAQGTRNSVIPLDQIQQADGYVLYDQQQQPVYYDVAMNRIQYDYIRSNGLYNATTQVSFSSKTNIVLPYSAIEVKGAWKVLTPAEAASGRFHTAPGYIPATGGGQGQTATVGLVGFHMFAAGGTQTVGLWATFYQVDNAPLAGTTPTGNYSFYKVGSSTPVNTTGTNPTQVQQVFADDPVAVTVSQLARNMIAQANPNSPWQYYTLANTQWSTTGLNFTTPVPATVPLATGSITTATLTNAVLETYMQTPGNSCLGCHSYANTAQQGSNTASGFSFMFGNAQAPAVTLPVKKKR